MCNTRVFEVDRECVYLCTAKPQTVRTHKLLCVWAFYCNPASVYLDQNHMCHFCTKTMINATFLSSQWGDSPCYWAVMCLSLPPPLLSWGRCHASSLIDSQISMSLYDTPGSCGCDEHQHSHWFCRSTSIELRVQPISQHMYLCAQLLYIEQRSYRKFNAQKSKILAGDGGWKSPLIFIFFYLISFETKLCPSEKNASWKVDQYHIIITGDHRLSVCIYLSHIY